MKGYKLFIIGMLIFALALVACGGAAETPTEEPMEEPTEAAPEPTEEPMEEPTEEPAEEPTEEPSEEPTEEPAEEPTEEPAMELMEGCEVDLTGETLTIHQHAGREGPLAAILGDAFALATEDAITEINESGGVCGAELEVIFRETNYDAELEVAAYEEARVFDPKPAILLTYGTAATVALNERVIEDEIVHIVAGLNAEAIYIPRNGYTVAAAPIYSDQFAGFVQWVHDNWDDVKPASAGDDIVVCVIGWASAFGAGATTPESLAYAESLGNVTVLPLEEQPIDPAADTTGQIQSCLVQGANVIYQQNLSFGTAQVIGTARALGVWDDILMGGNNWTGNIDVINILGENAALADGYHAVYPFLAFNDVDQPGIQQALEAFERSGYPDSDKSNTYLLTYSSFYNIAEILRRVVNEHGIEGVTGPNVLAAMQEMGVIDVLGIGGWDVTGENRASAVSQIRRATLNDEGMISYEVVQDFFELPDTRPPAP
jgi:branched-chain amino acid transport system substrate-binding protein